MVTHFDKKEFYKYGAGIVPDKSAIVQLVETLPDPIPLWMTPREQVRLRDYQRQHAVEVLNALQERRIYLEDSETGTGKTFIALWAARHLGAIPLVIGPKTTRISWQRAAEIMGIQIEYVNYEKLRGRRLRQEDGTLGTAESEWVLERKHGSGSFVEFKQQYEMVIFDEVHRCGGMTSLNGKVLVAAQKACRYLLMMSATALDDPRQMRALGRVMKVYDPKKGRGFYDWLLSHGCTPGVFGGFELTRRKEKLDAAFVKIRSEIFPDGKHGLRRRDIPTFPQTRVELALLDPTDKAEKLAGELEALYKLRAEQALRAHQQLEALRQQADELQAGVVAPGASILEEIIRKRQMLEALKIPDLIEMALESGRRCPVILFVSFVDSVDLLAKAFSKAPAGSLGVPGSVAVIDGRTSSNEAARQAIIDAFQANTIQYVVVNAAAGGEGISLHDPTGQIERVSYITPIQSGRRLVQILGRPQRDGGAFSTQYLAYFANTYEETVASRVIRKVRNVEILTDSDLM